MKRLVALIVLGALSTAAAGCDVSAPAATVDGVTVSRSQLDASLNAVADSAVAQCALAIQASAGGGSLPTVTGVGDHTVTTKFADFQLGGLVQQAIEQRALARRHIRVTAADVAAARQDFETQLGSAANQAASQGASPCNLSGTALVGRLPRAFVDQQARSLAYQERLEAATGHVDIRPAALRAYYDAHQSSAVQMCLDFIVMSNQADAQAVHDLIAGGTSFLVASQDARVAQGSPPGGQGPCVYPSTVTSQLGPAVETTLAALPDGVLAPPQAVQIQNQFGPSTTYWLVIEVRQHQLVPFSVVEGSIRRGLLSQGANAFGVTMDRLVRQARVVVDPQYGRWSTQGAVSGPVTPPPSLLLNTKADSAQSGGSILGGGLGGSGG